MNRTMLSGAAALAMLLSCATPAWSQPAPPSEEKITADLDGDGRENPIVLRQTSPGEMLLRAGLPGEFVDATISGESRGQPPVPIDVNGDGSDEIMVPESVGANTIISSVWRYSAEAGLHAVRTADGEQWRLAEGGSATTVSTYGCAPAATGRNLVSVNAYESAPDFSYRGNRVTYSVRDGVAHVVEEITIEDAGRDDPRLRGDPATCAPLR
ncbi:FG-GAP repeat domain-containing protein [Parasphingorhabdus pacifica]